MCASVTIQADLETDRVLTGMQRISLQVRPGGSSHTSSSLSRVADLGALAWSGLLHEVIPISV